MTQTNNYFPTFLVMIFTSQKFCSLSFFKLRGRPERTGGRASLGEAMLGRQSRLRPTSPRLGLARPPVGHVGTSLCGPGVHTSPHNQKYCIPMIQVM